MVQEVSLRDCTLRVDDKSKFTLLGAHLPLKFRADKYTELELWIKHLKRAIDAAKQHDSDPTQSPRPRERPGHAALKSQEKALIAIKENKFKDEITNFKIKSKKAEIDFNKDEHPRDGINLEGLTRLKPVFQKDGTVTAGNASGINDGAAAVTLMSEEEAKKRDLKKLVTIKSWASCGVEPALMGTGPIPATKKALDLAGWKIDDVDLFEVNEAFAAQSIAVLKTLGIPDEKVNVNGGAIAIGHPIGASGTRILVTLIHEMIKRDVKRGLATLCIGGGMGIAMSIER